MSERGYKIGLIGVWLGASLGFAALGFEGTAITAFMVSFFSMVLA
jgi:hypothetical protein